MTLIAPEPARIEAGQLDRLAMFPLPDGVLLPHAVLPLHVFEPRYRDLVRDCLDSGRLLTVPLLRPGWEGDYEGRPPVVPLAGAGEIVGHQTLPDGRYNILVRGLARIEILGEHPPDRAYRLARAALAADMVPAGRDLDGDRAALCALCDRIAARLPDEGATLLRRILHMETDPATLADLLGAALLVEPPARQRLLENLDVGERLDHLAEEIAGLIANLEAGEQGPALH